MMVRFRPEVMLIEPDGFEVELGEVRLNPNLEQILADEQWIDDATGLVPHCLAVLKTCRFLTERLTALTMGTLQSNSNGLAQIVEVNRFSLLSSRRFTFFCLERQKDFE